MPPADGAIRPRAEPGQVAPVQLAVVRVSGGELLIDRGSLQLGGPGLLGAPQLPQAGADAGQAGREVGPADRAVLREAAPDRQRLLDRGQGLGAAARALQIAAQLGFLTFTPRGNTSETPAAGTLTI
jgi:hypothetical protein